MDRRFVAGHSLKRGDIYLAILSADYGKPRPSIVVQSDHLRNFDSAILCGLTSDITTGGPTRLLIPHSTANGLTVDSMAMVEKISAVPKAKCRQRIGTLEPELLLRLDGLLAAVLGLTD